MEKLATELLQHIFTYACTDGGYTGCSLSAVSKHIRIASRSVRFYSVALKNSPPQITQLLSLLGEESSQSSEYPPRVRHLYLECRYSSDCIQATCTGERSSQDEFWTRYTNILSQLLRAVARDLRTLTIVFDWWVTAHRLKFSVPCAFPALQELTVAEDRTFLTGFTDGPTLLPSLKRLHVVSPRTMDFIQLARHAPRLTDLRVSDVGTDRAVLRSLKQLCGESGSGATHALRGLTRVLLQPPPPPPSGWCGTDVMMHLASVSELWRSQANAQVPVYFVPCVCRGCADRHDAVAMNAQAEWLARMEGGEGCWGVKEEWRARGVGQDGHMPPSYLVPGMGFGYREYVDKIIAIASEKAQTSR